MISASTSRGARPPQANAAPEGRRYEAFAYDRMGRATTETTPWDAVTAYEYDGKQVQITDPEKHVTTTALDALGRIVTTTDAKSGETSYTYGPFGGLTTVTTPGGAMTTTLRDAYGRVRTSNPSRLGHDDADLQRVW